MREDAKLVIKVPASTANLGPGFDSIGLALNLYLTVEVFPGSEWKVAYLTDELHDFPEDETNLICSTAIKTAAMFGKEMPGCHLRVNSEIPLARGLGSSAAAIVAGIELADSVCQLGLSKQEKFELASQFEGHPDNAGASLFGGLVIGCLNGEEANAAVFSDICFDIVAVVPKEELLTEASRQVLPELLDFKEAVTAGAVSNVLIAALLAENWQLAGKMMAADRYHQPYRRKLVPHLSRIEAVAAESGAFGTALSGAGPAVMCFIEKGKGDELASRLKKHIPDMDILSLEMDRNGSNVEKENYQISK
ncbi:homoserine kinase [Bacillus canaveralius]|uniref:homoserine kinase n=1 Tax=Bacillus canaveralius TaxID=1403243 RepID=UPI000F7A03A6|nr:homoserine kinase [Bacillus canaveralius]RSK55454.1 homoserine kinase [Bacillus canaveralius]